jgi:16S rRNA A1518/A1519 N6-dimethyltransferase RsmA/KsgA/DIM1 with predicted DNA glycosylase/AP lyase activity
LVLLIFATVIILINVSVLFYLFSLLASSPFVSIPNKLLPEIIKALDLKNDSVLYDLGSGDGRVLFAAWEKTPRAQFFGVDNNLAPIVASRFKKIIQGNPKNVHLTKGDIFKTNFSDATHIFTYLFPEPMQKLSPIMTRSLKPGTIVVSCNFKLPREAIYEVSLDNERDKAARRLYIYRF